jgi:photosystem II stability/assembly factor-like uncharacterized protein
LSAPSTSTAAEITARYGRLPLSFEENEGQTDGEVKFLSRGPGYDLFLTADGAVLSLRKNTTQIEDFKQPAPASASKPSMAQVSILRLKMIGANSSARVAGEEELPGKINYLIGDDPKQWHANIPTYRRVQYKEIFPGVDMVYYGNQQQLEYDFVVAPGADLRGVRFSLEGAENLSIDRKGDLVITVDRSEVKLRKPVIYQITDQGERNELVGSYVLKGNQVSFNVKNYNSKKALIIDPILSYSTYFGPAANALAIAVDASGNAYLTGTTTNSTFPTTAGSLKPINTQDGNDAFVTKLNSTGSALVYSTFLGGRSNETGSSIAVDSSGNAYITGDTTSANFPTVNPIRSSTSNFFKTSDTGGHWSGQFIGPSNGIVNVLVADPLNPTTIYAGMGNNGGGGVYKTTDGGVNWIALNTGLTAVNCPALIIDPTTTSTLYASLNPNNNSSASGLYKTVDGGTTWTKLTNGLSNITVSALGIDPSLPSTVYAGASFLGLFKSTDGGASWTNSSTGINFGGISAITVDPANSATVYASAGGGGVFKTINGGGNWSQVNNGLTNTSIRTLTIDSASNVYAGSSGGGLFKSTNGGGNWSPLNNGLPAFTSVTALALSPNAGTIFMGTASGRIYKSSDSGNSWTTSYETLTGTRFTSLIFNPANSSVLYAGVQLQSDSLIDHEAFVSKLNPAGSALVYSTYLGGSNDDLGRGIAVDSSGIAYVTGQTASASFPLVAAFQPTLKGGTDGFISKLNINGDALVYSTFLGGDGSEVANAIATDGAGNTYVTGSTSSTNFPLANPFQANLANGVFNSDAFVTKLSSAGALAYSTYLGGDGTDTGFGIAVDSSGNACVVGQNSSTNFPVLNPIQATNLGGFVTKLNNLGSGLIYSTYLADSRGIAVDLAGNAYVTGSTSSAAFPVVSGALPARSPFFITTNGGGNWNNDNYGLKSDVVSALALDPSNSSIIYAGIPGGVFKSIDGGRHWSAVNTGLNHPNVVKLVVDPTTPATVYLAASSSDGVYKSTDGGSTWNPANNGLGNGGITCLAIDPITPTTLYAGWGGGIFKTINGGVSWTGVGPLISSVTQIVVDPATPMTLYAAANSSGGGVYKSIDGGTNWQVMNNGLGGSTFAVSLAIDPITPSTLYAGVNGGLFKSVNAGNTWTAIRSGSNSVIAIAPSTPSIIYISGGFNGGIFKSTDGGNTWVPSAAVPKSGFVLALAINPMNPSTVYAGSQNFPSDRDAFVTKINSSGTAFVYSTLLGGNNDPNDSSGTGDMGFGIAVDSTGNAYVTGLTRSLDFPTTPDAYLPIPIGTAFVSKLTMSYQISGQVLDGSNVPLSGVEVVLSDGASLISVTTGSDGAYEFPRLREGGNFTVSAAKPHFTLTPASQTFNNLTSNQVVNFTATASAASFNTISGQITSGGVGLSGVTVTLSGSQAGLRTTDGSGNFSFTLASGGNYTLTPSFLGFSFTPPSQTFNNLSADQSANFVGTRQDFVVTNANDHGTGSLRQAMLDANATAGTDRIVFNIPGSGVHTIDLLIALPDVTEPVVIDAATQPGYAGTPLVELNGTAVGANSAGFKIIAGGTTIRGFVINRFNNAGFGAIYLTTNGSNVIQGNYIGLDSSGTIRRSNYNGIILGNSSNNLIGGTTTAARNVISGSSFDGITVSGSNNQISGNFIGTNAAGTAEVGNGINGIVVNGSVPSFVNNVIGGTTPGAGNLISGNQRGISLNSPGVSIQGNLIGTDVSGTLAVGNGVGIQNFPGGVVIGGTVPGARNIISGNTEGLTIVGVGSRLEGNFIGTDITGTVALGNTSTGVVAGNGALIGGTTPEARNVISGNGGFGNISLGSNSSGGQATVQGNYIGTDVTGTFALTNPAAGISISGSGNLIGGLVPGARNVISGNQIGIQIGGSIAPGPVSNKVQGNLIGFNALGTAPVPNLQGGIRVNDSSTNIIGGLENGAANRIAFSGGAGVSVSSGTGNVVRGNLIFSNNGLGIDLGTSGVTPNDTGDADTGPNNLQNFPVLSSVSVNAGFTTIQGSLNSTPNTVFKIDFYSNSACDPSGNGEGANFFDTTNVTTDANGAATINFASLSVSPTGRTITATATDPAGNTSEFSSCSSSQTTGSVQFSTASYSVVEDVGNLTIEVIRTGGSKGTLSVNYSSANGTATAGSDYTAVSGALVFADGELSKTFTLPITNDAVAEPTETLRLSLTAADLETLGSPAVATVNILDNSTPLILSMNNVDVTEGNSGTTNAVITVTLSAATGRTITADFATLASTATSGVDFTATSGSLSFGPGVTTQTISVPIIGDTLNEATEMFFVTLSNAVNATTTGFASTVRILNDDPLPLVSIADVSVTEGNSGTVNAVFNVSLSTASGRALSVGYATANNTATSTSDYVATSGRVTFNAGETLKTITVVVNGDLTNESDETFFVNLSSPANVALGDIQGIGTILNDDGPGAGSVISFSQSSYNVGESDGQATITVTRTNDLSGPADVNYTTSDGSVSGIVVPCSTVNGLASSRCDFTSALGTLHFAAGESSKAFTVLISQDNYVEGPETLTLNLSNSTGAVLGTTSSATLTINDDVTEPSANPIDNAEVFVRQHYHDFLNRDPDAPGLAYWAGQITECGADAACIDIRRVNVSAAFFLSIEFQETGYLVERIYKSAYGDADALSALDTYPSQHPIKAPIVRFNEFLGDSQQISKDVQVGVGNWTGQLEANKVAFTQDFVTRTRFTTAYPTTMTPAQFVDALFVKISIVPDAAERTSIINEFGGAGTTADTAARARALRRVAENGALKQAEKNKAFVLMQYFGYMRRNPDDPQDTDHTGYDFWLHKLNEHNGNFVSAEMVKAFIVSGEYRNRFGN